MLSRLEEGGTLGGRYPRQIELLLSGQLISKPDAQIIQTLTLHCLRCLEQGRRQRCQVGAHQIPGRLDNFNQSLQPKKNKVRQVFFKKSTQNRDYVIACTSSTLLLNPCCKRTGRSSSIVRWLFTFPESTSTILMQT